VTGGQLQHGQTGATHTKKVKGVKSDITAKFIIFDDYTRYLQDEIEMTRNNLA